MTAQRIGAAPSLTLVIFCVLLFGVGLCISRDIERWRANEQPEMQTSARLACPRPTPLETGVLFYTLTGDGQVHVRCGSVTGNGRRKAR